MEWQGWPGVYIDVFLFVNFYENFTFCLYFMSTLLYDKNICVHKKKETQKNGIADDNGFRLKVNVVTMLRVSYILSIR